MPGPLRASKRHAYRPYWVPKRVSELEPRPENNAASFNTECDDTTTTTHTTTTTTTANTTPADSLLSFSGKTSTTLLGEDEEVSADDTFAHIRVMVARRAADPRKRPSTLPLRCSTPPRISRPHYSGREMPPPLLLSGEECEYETCEEVLKAFEQALEEEVEGEEEEEEEDEEFEEEEDSEDEEFEGMSLDSEADEEEGDMSLDSEADEEFEEEVFDSVMEERVEAGLEQSKLQLGETILAHIQATSQESAMAKVHRLRQALLRKRQYREVTALLAQQDQWLLPKLQRRQEYWRVKALLQRQDECLEKEAASSEVEDATMEADATEPLSVEDASMEVDSLLLVEEEDEISDGGPEDDSHWAESSDDEETPEPEEEVEEEVEEDEEEEEDGDEGYDSDDSLLLLVLAASED